MAELDRNGNAKMASCCEASLHTNSKTLVSDEPGYSCVDIIDLSSLGICLAVMCRFMPDIIIIKRKREAYILRNDR